MRLVKWKLKVRKQLDLKLEKETLRNRSGPEVEEEGKDKGDSQGRDEDGDQRRKDGVSVWEVKD